MNAGDFAAIEARLAAATEGPWEIIGGGEYIAPIGITVAPDDGGVTTADAEFIAHARVDIPALLAAVRERDNTIARVRALAERWAEERIYAALPILAAEIIAALDPQETP